MHLSVLRALYGIREHYVAIFVRWSPIFVSFHMKSWLQKLQIFQSTTKSSKVTLFFHCYCIDTLNFRDKSVSCNTYIYAVLNLNWADSHIVL